MTFFLSATPIYISDCRSFICLVQDKTQCFSMIRLVCGAINMILSFIFVALLYIRYKKRTVNTFDKDKKVKYGPFSFNFFFSLHLNIIIFVVSLF